MEPESKRARILSRVLDFINAGDWQEGDGFLIFGSETLRYENQVVVAEGDYVIAHGRFSGSEGLRPGLRPTLSDSKSVSWLNTGMCCRTKPRRFR